MIDQTEFNEWWKKKDQYDRYDKQQAWEVWQARQPEIDALKLGRRVAQRLEHNAKLEIERLQAEIERLREYAAKGAWVEAVLQTALSAAPTPPEVEPVGIVSSRPYCGRQLTYVDLNENRKYLNDGDKVYAFPHKIFMQADHIEYLLGEDDKRKSENERRIGSWLSAALDDPNVCEAMKADIRAWFGERL